MKRIAKFENVSRSRFETDFVDCFGDVTVPALPALPHRATAGSAGYDFYMPCDLTLAPGECAKIPTGIRNKKETNSMKVVNLMCFVRQIDERLKNSTEQLFDFTKQQVALVNEYPVDKTFLLQYDTVSDEQFVRLFKEETDERTELGLCEDAPSRSAAS